MNRFIYNVKRQLLADLSESNAISLPQYRTSMQRAGSPHPWIINDEVNKTVYGIGKDGSQHSLTIENLKTAPPNIISTVADFSGGKRILERMGITTNKGALINLSSRLMS